MNDQDDFSRFYKLYQQNRLDDIKNLNIKFVRSQNYISEYKENATGRQISAFEMAVLYGDKINEILDYGSAKLRISKAEPALSFKNARESLGLTIEQVAKRLDLSECEVADAEDYTTRTKFSILSSLAHLYGILDHEISTKKILKNHSYLVDLRTFSEKASLDVSTICEISTAIWIARTQKELEKYLGINQMQSPTIPIIQTNLSESIDRVTICNNDIKVVIINSKKRLTLASIPESRQGTFFTRVMQALNKKILVPCTAASYLHCTEKDLITLQEKYDKSI